MKSTYKVILWRRKKKKGLPPDAPAVLSYYYNTVGSSYYYNAVGSSGTNSSYPSPNRKEDWIEMVEKKATLIENMLADNLPDASDDIIRELSQAVVAELFPFDSIETTPGAYSPYLPSYTGGNTLSGIVGTGSISVAYTNPTTTTTTTAVGQSVWSTSFSHTNHTTAVTPLPTKNTMTSKLIHGNLHGTASLFILSDGSRTVVFPDGTTTLYSPQDVSFPFFHTHEAETFLIE